MIVRKVLDAANADQSGHLWSSLSAVLPTLAEASPGYFLDAVDAGLASGGLRSVFDPEVEMSFRVTRPAPACWVGLEALDLVTSPTGFTAAGPGPASLRSTRAAATPTARTTASARSSCPGARRPPPAAMSAWRCIDLDPARGTGHSPGRNPTGLLPVPHAVLDFSYKPRWCEWDAEGVPGTPRVSAAELDWHAAEVAGKPTVQDAGLDGRRWADSYLAAPAPAPVAGPARRPRSPLLGALDPGRAPRPCRCNSRRAAPDPYVITGGCPTRPGDAR